MANSTAQANSTPSAMASAVPSATGASAMPSVRGRIAAHHTPSVPGRGGAGCRRRHASPRRAAGPGAVATCREQGVRREVQGGEHGGGRCEERGLSHSRRAPPAGLPRWTMLAAKTMPTFPAGGPVMKKRPPTLPTARPHGLAALDLQQRSAGGSLAAPPGPPAGAEHRDRGQLGLGHLVGRASCRCRCRSPTPPSSAAPEWSPADPTIAHRTA